MSREPHPFERVANTLRIGEVVTLGRTPEGIVLEVRRHVGPDVHKRIVAIGDEEIGHTHFDVIEDAIARALRLLRGDAGG